MREQYDQVDIVETGKRVDRGPPGIARGCHHDGGALRPLRQHVVHQPRDQLHRDVLERERRTVKQLQQELIGTDLIERNHGGVTERGVGLVRHAPEIGVGNLVADKRTDHIDRDFPIGPAEKSRDGLGRKLRPGFGHVKTAVAGKPGQHDVAETQDGGLPPGRNVSRQTALQRLRLSAKPLIFIENITLSMTKPRGTIKRFRRKGKCRNCEKMRTFGSSAMRLAHPADACTPPAGLVSCRRHPRRYWPPAAMRRLTQDETGPWSRSPLRAAPPWPADP